MSNATTGGSTKRSDAPPHRHDPITVGLHPPGGEPIAITHDPDGQFTPRQRQVLALVAKGMSNAEIAAQLGISRRTVEKHVETIHMKAGTATRARLVAYSAKRSL